MSSTYTKKDAFIAFVSGLVAVYAMGAGAVWYTTNYDPEIYEKTKKEWEGGWAGVIERALK